MIKDEQEIATIRKARPAKFQIKLFLDVLTLLKPGETIELAVRTF